MTIDVIPDSAAAVAEAVRDARSTRTSLRITGARQWLDAGRPCTATSELCGLVSDFDCLLTSIRAGHEHGNSR